MRLRSKVRSSNISFSISDEVTSNLAKLDKLCEEVSHDALTKCIKIVTRVGAKNPENDCCYLIQKYGEDIVNALEMLAKKGLLRAAN